MLQSKKNWVVGNRKWEVGILLLTSYFLLLISVFLSGCATTEDMGRIQYDLIKLKSEVKDINQKFQALEHGGEFNKRLEGLEEEQKATSKAVSDLVIKVQSLTAELQILTGRFEEVRYYSEKSSKEQAEAKDTLIAKVKEIEVAVNALKEKLDILEASGTKVKKQKTAEEPKEEPKKTEGVDITEGQKGTEEGKTAESDVKNAYTEAYKTFQEEKYAEAREKFLAFLKNYPENEYSDNARFWIAESYYKEKNYEDAILAYEKLLKKNSNSDKVPGALLKQGLAFYELKDKKTGKILLEKVIEQFPDSKQAKIAKKKLSPTKKVESSE